MFSSTGSQHNHPPVGYGKTQDTNFPEDLIRRVIDERIRDDPTSSTLIHRQILDCLRVLPSKSYGDTSLSENSNAILGDVYQFYNSDSNGEQHKILQNLQKRVEDLCQRQDDRDAKILHLTELLKKSKAATPSNDRNQEIDVSTLIANLKVEQNSEEILQDCETIAIARQFLPDLCVDATTYLPDLEEWACSHGSGLLLVQAEPMAEDAAKDLAVNIARYLKDAALPVAWYFSAPSAPTGCVSVATVLQTLIVQLIDMVPGIQFNACNSEMGDEQRRIIPESDLITFFHIMISKLPCWFLIVEVSSQNNADASSKEHAQQLADTFANMVQQTHVEDWTLKILMVHQDTISIPPLAANNFKPIQSTFISATQMPLARARLQAVRMQNDLTAILERAVLIAKERFPSAVHQE